MKIERCALIKADQSEVWEVLADFEGEKAWNPVLKAARIISEEKSGLGCARASEYEGGWALKERIIEFDEGMRLCEVAFEGLPFDSNKTCFTLERAANGTDVTWEFEYEGVPMALNEEKFRKYAAKGMEKALLGLRDRVLGKIPAV